MLRFTIPVALAIALLPQTASARKVCVEEVGGVCLKFEERREASPALTSERRLNLGRADRRRIQTALRIEGHYAGAIDSLFGPGTRRAISVWQGARGEARTGYLTAVQAETLIALGIASGSIRSGTSDETGSTSTAAPSTPSTVDRGNILGTWVDSSGDRSIEATISGNRIRVIVRDGPSFFFTGVGSVGTNGDVGPITVSALGDSWKTGSIEGRFPRLIFEVWRPSSKTVFNLRRQ